MILYPTETIYGLGVNALDDAALAALFALKGRDESQTVSWLVRDVADMERYAELSDMARRLAEVFLPGPLTLVLPALDTVPQSRRAPDATVGLRISADPVAQEVVATFMAEHNAPLTCTSANVSGRPPQPTPAAIIEQFTAADRDTSVITKTIDDGLRAGDPSTVVRVIGDTIDILRVGSLSEDDIKTALN